MPHNEYMRRALALAEQAALDGDVPVGCVIVKDGQVIGEGRNRREAGRDATAHAEVEAIRAACTNVGHWRLHKTALYVTLEPCPMCAGAILNARIPSVYFGARDEKSGACGSVFNLFEERGLHKPKLVGGVLNDECAAAMSEFFRALRGK